ncbi:hypothetical protein VE03_01109 [Pseudogymnoascus sp. 23342-1-I1]|nr:hypothetical protein VE03_01109 [Pseudogymnoascus sp. 23342-1-I1]
MAPIKLDDNAAYMAYKLLTERPLGMKPFGKDVSSIPPPSQTLHRARRWGVPFEAAQSVTEWVTTGGVKWRERGYRQQEPSGDEKGLVTGGVKLAHEDGGLVAVDGFSCPGCGREVMDLAALVVIVKLWVFLVLTMDSDEKGADGNSADSI